MSYMYETGSTSPNRTEYADVARTWGVPRTYQAIAIHWWGDPNNNPSFDGIVNYLCRPGGNSSAHFVISGTGRRAAQIVDFDDAAWATNSANPYTIALELDPRCRDEDYDTAAEVIAQIWDAFGYMPLVPHRKFVATACPGNYDLARLEAIAKTKNGSGDWGNVTPINQPEPAPTPPEPVDTLYRLFQDGKQVAAYSQEKNAYLGWVAYGSRGTIMYQGRDVTQEIVDKHKPQPQPEPVPEPTPEPTPEPEPTPTPEPEPEPTPDPDAPTTLWEDIVKWFNKLVELLKQYKR